jgi:SAM-dependent methyltransferase
LEKDAKTILDVGCGKGAPMGFINREGRFILVGVDVSIPALCMARKRKVYRDLVLGDVRCLPFRNRAFDVLICAEVLEHLERRDGEHLLDDLTRLACRQILLTTPVGEYEQGSIESNPFQEHRRIWNPDELKMRGYKVRGVGLQGLGGDQSWTASLGCLGSLLKYCIYSVATIVSYWHPEISCHMIAERTP